MSGVQESKKCREMGSLYRHQETEIGDGSWEVCGS